MAYIVMAWHRYISDFAYKSIETAEFKQHFTAFFSNDAEVADRLGTAITT